MQTEHQNIPFSISDKALIGEDPFEGLKLLSLHGFTHLHLSYKWNADEDITEAQAERFQSALKEANLKVLDVHGPHPHGTDFGAEDPETRKIALERFRYRLKLTHIFGGDAMVYHVPTLEFTEHTLHRYVDGLKQVEEEAREWGIKIALENHYKPEIDKRTLPLCFEQFDPSYIGFTFDPGHASISGNFDWLLDNCMERLCILHLNDNDGKGDRHWNPYTHEGVVDWDKLARGVANSPYQKPLQLEVSWHKDKHPSREGFLHDAASAIRKQYDHIQTLRQK